MRVGNYLKQIREEKNVTLDTVSHKTKINTRSLEALENNEFDMLPNKVYVIAYVKNYCKSLGIDNEKALELLSDEYESTDEEELAVEETATSFTSAPKMETNSGANELIGLILKKLSDKRVIFTVIFLVIVISLTFKIKEIVDRKLPPANTATQEASSTDEIADTDEIPEEDKQELDKVIAKDIEENTPTEKVEVDKKKKVDASAKKIETVKEEVEKEEKKETEVNTAENESQEEKDKIAEELKRYKQIRNTMYLLDPNATEVTDPDIYPVSFRNQVAADKHNVFIAALFDDVWYRYKIDDKPIRQNTLKQGRKIMLTGDDTVMVFLGNFFATKVIYNNNLVNGKAPAGVKSLIFPHEKRTDYYLPLFAKDKDGRSITSKEFVETNSN